MKFYRKLCLILALMFLAGCSGQSAPSATQGAANTPDNSKLPTPVVYVTNAPDPQTALRTFLEAWKNDDYASMYPLLSQESQSSIKLEDFVALYRDTMNALTLKEMSYEITNKSLDSISAQVN